MKFALVFTLILGFSSAKAAEVPVVSNGLTYLSASSVYDSTYNPGRARFDYSNIRVGGACWAPANTDKYEWLQISYREPIEWTKLVTQGRNDADWWVTSFRLDYTLNGVDWESYNTDRVFIANFDRSTPVAHILTPPLVARSIRLIILTYHGFPALRVEAFTSGLDGTFSVTASDDPIPALNAGLSIAYSSIYNPTYDTNRLRLNFDTVREGYKCWLGDSASINNWVQITDVASRKWVKIQTQGCGNVGYWVTQFYISYTINGREWHLAEGGKLYTANSDQNTIITNEFEEPFIAKSIRVHPVQWNGYPTLRMEGYFFEDLS